MAGTKVSAAQESINIQGNFKATILDCGVVVNAVQYTEEYDYMLAGLANGGIVAIDKESKLSFTLSDNMTNATYLTGLKHRPVSRSDPITNNIMCSYGNGLLKCWNYNFKECTFTTEENRLTTGLQYHPKHSKFVTFGDDKKINLYDEDSKRQERVLSASDDKSAKNGHTGTVTCACFHPRNVNELISGSLDNTVQFWDTRQPNAMKNISGVTINGPGIEFSPKGTEFITCSPEVNKGSNMRLWDYANGTEIKKIEPDNFKATPLRCGSYLTRNHFACGGGPPNFVRIVDMTTFKSVSLISNVQQPVLDITIGPPNAAGMGEFTFCAGKRIYIIKPITK